MELVIAAAVVGIVAAVAVPQYSAYKERAYDTTAQADLRTAFQACQEFWTFNSSNSPCLLNAASNTASHSEFRSAPTDSIEIKIDSDVNNTEYDFIATARHPSSSNSFVIDHRGIVSKLKGCSAVAHNDPNDLGHNAKGGCGTAPTDSTPETSLDSTPETSLDSTPETSPVSKGKSKAGSKFKASNLKAKLLSFFN